MQLSKEFFLALPPFVEYTITKHFALFRDNAGKKACFSGKKVQLNKYEKQFGENFFEITDEEAKLRHLGKMRCIGKVLNENELLILFSKHFNFEIKSACVIKEKDKTVQKVIQKKKENEKKVNQQPNERDEKQLVLKFRDSSSKRERDKIFRTILYKRGVNGKTWDQIIKNYVSFHKHRFAQFTERSESDFYQDIVTALYNQIVKWFDVEKDFCFSTYAWYVINCAFNRVLQSLSTKKRKPTLNKVELDDCDNSWNETISIEKTQLPQSNFEDDLIKKNLCNYIQEMFKLKPIDAPEQLKQELIEIIRNKSIIQNPLYALAKKYDISIKKIFILEKEIRENLQNSMYNDIIRNIKYDINGDEDIAKKYKRSKGHIIKMKKNISTVVKSRLKEL